MEDLQTKLIDLAKKAQEKSYSPYSKFAVGAALMTQDGSIFRAAMWKTSPMVLPLAGNETLFSR